MILLTIALVIIGLLIGFAIFVYTGPQLPENTDALIAELDAEGIPEIVPGTIGYAQSGSVSICYETAGDPNSPKGTMLMICGYTLSLASWPEHFYNALLDSGFHVVRFDNRGVGKSAWMKNWSKANAYKLEDMAKDAIAVLDHLGIEKAHVLGASMGGMIAQRVAISHSERVLSLTSIMSTGYYNDPELQAVPGKFRRDFARYIFRYPPRKSSSETQRLKLHLGIVQMLKGKGDYQMDRKGILRRAMYEIRNRNGFNIKAGPQHEAAIKGSGSRYAELGQIKAPTLVIHGTTDPLVTFPHGKKYAPMIPNATTLFVEGMGHDLPKIYMPEIIQHILDNCSKAEKSLHEFKK